MFRPFLKSRINLDTPGLNITARQ